MHPTHPCYSYSLFTSHVYRITATLNDRADKWIIARLILIPSPTQPRIDQCSYT